MNIVQISNIIDDVFDGVQYGALADKHGCDAQRVRNTVSYVKSGRLPFGNAAKLRQLRGQITADEFTSAIDAKWPNRLTPIFLQEEGGNVESAMYKFLIDDRELTLHFSRRFESGKFRFWRADLTVTYMAGDVTTSDGRIHTAIQFGPTPLYAACSAMRVQTVYWQQLLRQIPRTAFPQP